MKFRRHWNAAAFLWTVAAVSALQQRPLSTTRSPDILGDDLSLFVEEVLCEWNSPGGVSIAVTHRVLGNVWATETRGYGFADVNHTRKVTDETLFAIASNSKHFTAVSAGLLVHNESLEPRIDWDTKIKSVIPEWDLTDSIGAEYSTITDLMSHRTGVPGHDLMYSFLDDMSSTIAKVAHLELSTEFRETFQYNNIFYGVLSELPTRLIPNTTFTSYMRDNVFTPHGMNSTTYFYKEANATRNLADGITRHRADFPRQPFSNGTPRALPYFDQLDEGQSNLINGCGGIISNAKDLAKWLRVLLGSTEGSERSIPQEVFRKISGGITVMVPTSFRPGYSPVVYGGGIARHSYRGHEVLFHTGGVPGFLTDLTWLPNDDFGVAVLTNDEELGGYIHDIIKWKIVNTFLKLEPFDWNAWLKDSWRKEAVPKTRRRPDQPSLPTESLDALAGNYSHPAYGNIELCSVVVWSSPVVSDSCKALVNDLQRILPGSFDPKIPSLVAHWNKMVSTHLQLEHFDGNVFNGTGLSSIVSDDGEHWTYVNSIEKGLRFTAEFSAPSDSRKGLAMMGGFWGAGTGVSSPSGDNAYERAEVWFERM